MLQQLKASDRDQSIDQWVATAVRNTLLDEWVTAAVARNLPDHYRYVTVTDSCHVGTYELVAP